MQADNFLARAQADAVRAGRERRETFELRVRSECEWLPVHYKLPSPMVWTILVCGSRTGNGYRDLQSVVTGFVQAGWELPYVERALGQYRGHGSPGAWVA